MLQAHPSRLTLTGQPGEGRVSGQPAPCTTPQHREKLLTTRWSPHRHPRVSQGLSGTRPGPGRELGQQLPPLQGRAGCLPVPRAEKRTTNASPQLETLAQPSPGKDAPQPNVPGSGACHVPEDSQRVSAGLTTRTTPEAGTAAMTHAGLSADVASPFQHVGGQGLGTDVRHRVFLDTEVVLLQALGRGGGRSPGATHLLETNTDIHQGPMTATAASPRSPAPKRGWGGRPAAPTCPQGHSPLPPARL